MAKVRDIYRFLDEFAPFSIQEDFDNAGFLVGRDTQQVTRVLTALDITVPVILEAEKIGAELIVGHHPVIFHPLKAVTNADPAAERVLLLAEKGIAAICAHTNLDAVAGGVNDCLAQVLGLTDIRQLAQAGEDGQGRAYGIGRIGTWAASADTRTPEFAAIVKEKLQAPCVRYHDAGRPIRRVAVGGGSCGSLLRDALAAGCDSFVTADIKHDVFLDAAQLGINLLDAGHFSTEDVVIKPLTRGLQEAFPAIDVRCSEVQKAPCNAV